VVSVQAIVVSLESLQIRRNHNLLESLTFFFGQALRTPGFAITELSVPILVRSTNLPGNPPPGPVDRILIATCRQHGLSIVTRDRKILAYAEQGYIAAVAC
ncbi:MAG: PIN domain-containing protein, partial [Pseudomonadota bacterium]|nr:PIN domain-containing protein [Pseudomonadota bacterium]